MSAEIRAIADAARELLNQGDPVGAEKLLSPIFNDLKSDAPVLHLMGIIKKSQSQWADAERHLRAAIAGALSEGAYYNDLGVVLQQRGNFAEAIRIFQAAIALMPGAAQPRINLTRCFISAGDHKGAEVEARILIRIAPSADAWTLLAQVQRAQDRVEDAVKSSEEAVRLAPDRRSYRHNLAIAYERVGKSKQALEQFERLARDGVDTPELAVNLARAYQADNRAEQGEAVLEQAVKQWPGSTVAHSALARLRWLNGAGESATAFLEEAVRARPNDLALRLVCADLLHRAEYSERARRVLEDGLRLNNEEPALLSSMGVVLDETGRIEEALVFLRRAAFLTPGVIKTHRNLIPTMLRARQAEEALQLIRAGRETAPEDQELIAFEACALRILGDPAYHHLYDYGRLVQATDIAAPRGFFGIENFNASLAETLRVLHQSSAHPLDQNIRNGTQTSRNLLTEPEVNLQAFFTAMDAPIQAYIKALHAHPQDPVGRRRSNAYRFGAAWSVKLQTGGYQINHVRQGGWISGAYYVEAPAPAAGAPEHARWLKFGEPRLPTPGCEPAHFVEPKPGRVVLFPSYMWHGTVPHAGPGEQLTVSFDIIPA